MKLRPTIDKLFKNEDRPHNIGKHKEGIQKNLFVISRAISQLSIRKATDPDAEEFMRKQFIYALSGGNDLVQGTDSEVHPNLQSDYEEMIQHRNTLTEDFLSTSSADETYLGIIEATEVGCHHPALSSIDPPPSALSLHGPLGLCQNCTKEYRSKSHLSRGVMNPFRCWRRGHRSGEFGFIYRITIGQDKNSSKWNIRPNSGQYNHRIFASSNVLAGLQYAKNRKRFEEPIPRFSPLEESLSAQMMVSIHIISDEEIILDETEEIKTLLPSQLLVSRHIDLKQSIKQEGDYENLPAQLKELILSIHHTWKTVAPSSDSEGILSLVIVQEDCDEIVEVLKPHLNELPFLLEDDCDMNSINSLLKDAIIHNSGTKAKLAICIKLDPIMDIGGDLNRL